MLAGAWKSYLKKLQKTHKTPEGRQCEAPCRCLLGLAPFSRHPDFLVGRNSTERMRGLSDGCFVALLLCGVLGPVPAGPPELRVAGRAVPGSRESPRDTAAFPWHLGTSHRAIFSLAPVRRSVRRQLQRARAASNKSEAVTTISRPLETTLETKSRSFPLRHGF